MRSVVCCGVVLRCARCDATGMNFAPASSRVSVSQSEKKIGRCIYRVLDGVVGGVCMHSRALSGVVMYVYRRCGRCSRRAGCCDAMRCDAAMMVLWNVRRIRLRRRRREGVGPSWEADRRVRTGPDGVLGRSGRVWALWNVRVFVRNSVSRGVSRVTRGFPGCGV